MRLAIAICCSFFAVVVSAGPGADQCYEDYIKEMKSSPVSSQMGFGISLQEMPFEKLANTSFATDEDKPWIAKSAERSRVCNDLEIAEMPKDVHPGFPEIFKDSGNKKQELLIELYNKKISYGEYLRERQKQVDIANNKLSKLRDEVETSNQLAKAQEKAATSRAWADFFGGMSKAFSPKPSVNCVPNGFGGMRCQ